MGAPSRTRRPADPHRAVGLRRPHRPQAGHDARAGAQAGRGDGRVRALPVRQRRVLARGRRPRRSRLPDRDGRDDDRGRAPTSSTSPTPPATACLTSSASWSQRVINEPGRGQALFSVHCHNDLGLAIANTLAALTAGARRVECTINGIGERAGNTSLEEIVMLLRVRQSRLGLECAVEPTEITRTSRLVAELTGTPVQPNKAVVGRQRIRPRVRHPPGRRPEGPLELRDHEAGGRRSGRVPASC